MASRSQVCFPHAVCPLAGRHSTRPVTRVAGVPPNVRLFCDWVALFGWGVGFLLTAVAVPGCSGHGTVPTYDVSGAVTFDGTPLPHGSIVFDSVDGLTAPVMGAIEEGRYAVKAPAGEKIVRVDAVRTLDQKDQYGSAVTESFIPQKYNSDSRLRMTVSAIDMNPFDVDMESSTR
jgi:hypothetical protein